MGKWLFANPKARENYGVDSSATVHINPETPQTGNTKKGIEICYHCKDGIHSGWFRNEHNDIQVVDYHTSNTMQDPH